MPTASLSDGGGAAVRVLPRPRKASGSRSAFAVTTIDDVDIAIAAISGVAWPSIAIGTATDVVDDRERDVLQDRAPRRARHV